MMDHALKIFEYFKNHLKVSAAAFLSMTVHWRMYVAEMPVCFLPSSWKCKGVSSSVMQLNSVWNLKKKHFKNRRSYFIVSLSFHEVQGVQWWKESCWRWTALSHTLSSTSLMFLKLFSKFHTKFNCIINTFPWQEWKKKPACIFASFERFELN